MVFYEGFKFIEIKKENEFKIKKENEFKFDSRISSRVECEISVFEIDDNEKTLENIKFDESLLLFDESLLLFNRKSADWWGITSATTATTSEPTHSTTRQPTKPISLYSPAESFNPDLENDYLILGLSSGHIDAKSIVIVANKASPDLSIIALTRDGVWDNWELDEGCGIVLPIDEDGNDTYPVKMALDFTSTDLLPGPTPDSSKIPPCPILHLETSTGLVLSFHCVFLGLDDHEDVYFKRMGKDPKYLSAFTPPLFSARKSASMTEKKEEKISTDTAKPAFSFPSKTTDAQKPAFSFATKPDTEKSAFSFATKPDTEKSAFSFATKPDTEKPAFSFATKPDTEKPVFSFGTKPDQPTFSFATRPDTVKKEEKPAFSFAAAKTESVKQPQQPPFSFAPKTDGEKKEDKPAFSFAAASKPVTEKPAFSFATKPAETVKKDEKPAFSFAAKPAETVKKDEKPAFSFAAKPANPDTEKKHPVVAAAKKGVVDISAPKNQILVDKFDEYYTALQSDFTTLSQFIESFQKNAIQVSKPSQSTDMKSQTLGDLTKSKLYTLDMLHKVEKTRVEFEELRMANQDQVHLTNQMKEKQEECKKRIKCLEDPKPVASASVPIQLSKISPEAEVLQSHLTLKKNAVEADLEVANDLLTRCMNGKPKKTHQSLLTISNTASQIRRAISVLDSALDTASASLSSISLSINPAKQAKVQKNETSTKSKSFGLVGDDQYGDESVWTPTTNPNTLTCINRSARKKALNQFRKRQAVDVVQVRSVGDGVHRPVLRPLSPSALVESVLDNDDNDVVHEKVDVSKSIEQSPVRAKTPDVSFGVKSPDVSFGVHVKEKQDQNPDVSIAESTVSSKSFFSLATKPVAEKSDIKKDLFSVSKPLEAAKAVSKTDENAAKPAISLFSKPLDGAATPSKPGTETPQSKPLFSFAKPGTTTSETPKPKPLESFSFAKSDTPSKAVSETPETKPLFSFAKPTPTSSETPKPVQPFSFAKSDTKPGQSPAPSAFFGVPATPSLFNNPPQKAKDVSFSFGDTPKPPTTKPKDTKVELKLASPASPEKVDNDQSEGQSDVEQGVDDTFADKGGDDEQSAVEDNQSPGYESNVDEGGEEQTKGELEEQTEDGQEEDGQEEEELESTTQDRKDEKDSFRIDPSFTISESRSSSPGSKSAHADSDVDGMEEEELEKLDDTTSPEKATIPSSFSGLGGFSTQPKNSINPMFASPSSKAEDYSKPNPFVQPKASTSFGGFGSTTPPFGVTASTEQPGFGSTGFGKPSGAFGQAPAKSSAFGTFADKPNAFGSFADKPSVFGQSSDKPSAFGQTASKPSAFGQSSDKPSAFGQSASPFGQSADKPSAFGQQSASPFGQTSGTFGTSSPFGTPQKATFGQSNTTPTSTAPTSTPPTGQTQNAFGTPQKSGFGQSPFGQQTSNGNGTSSFNQASTGQSGFGSSSFGSNQTNSVFGGGSTSATPAFGQSSFGGNQAASPAFGQSGFGSSQTTAPTFGQSAFGSSQPTSSFGAGASTTSAFGQSGFGASPSAAPAFGQSTFGASSNTQPAFGSSGFGKPATMGGNMSFTAVPTNTTAFSNQAPVSFASFASAGSNGGSFGSGGSFSSAPKTSSPFGGKPPNDPKFTQFR